MHHLIQEIVDNPAASLIVIGNLILIESLLSIDNAAVLATMVMDLPKDQRKKALRYGIVGAYVFRGLALLFAAYLVKFWYLKALGGFYLLYLTWSWWKGKQTEAKDDDFVNKKDNWLYRLTVGAFGNFWATVALVELMDMAFSIDNIFAAAAFSDNILIIILGVFIGILAMRFVAQGFIKLMEKYAFLETCAFIVIAVLGVKLVFSLYTHFYPCSAASIFMEGSNDCITPNLPASKTHAMAWGEILTSILTVAIFSIPVITSLLFNLPKRAIKKNED